MTNFTDISRANSLISRAFHGLILKFHGVFTTFSRGFNLIVPMQQNSEVGTANDEMDLIILTFYAIFLNKFQIEAI